MKIAVWFSCGAASAVALAKTVERYGREAVRAVNNPVVEEHPDNLRFLSEVEAFVGVPIERAINPDFPTCSAEDVWRTKRYMAGVAGATCTTQLKKEARYRWERENPVDYHVLGFTADERRRHDRFVLTERENVLPVLIEENLTKQDCFRIVQSWGIALPASYLLGYPNANCIGCVKSASPAYWNHVRRTHPEVFQQRAALSREIGCKLIERTTKGKKRRYFLDELPEEWGKGQKLGPAPDCSSFCEEP